MFCLDTSVLVSAHCNEAHTAITLDWLERQSAASLYISNWLVTEFSSALSLKLRTRQINIQQRNMALSAFALMRENTLLDAPVIGSDFIVAAHMLDNHQLGLRAGDALHLAVASRCGLTLVTLDARMANAGQLLAVNTLLLNAKNQINELSPEY